MTKKPAATKKKRANRKTPVQPETAVDPYSLGFGVAAALVLMNAPAALALGVAAMTRDCLQGVGDDWLEEFEAGFVFAMENIGPPGPPR